MDNEYLRARFDTPNLPPAGAGRDGEDGALHLPLQHPHLVSKHQELDLPSLIWALPRSEDAANEEVDEREQDGSPSHRGERMLPATRDPRIVDSEPFT